MCSINFVRWAISSNYRASSGRSSICSYIVSKDVGLYSLHPPRRISPRLAQPGGANRFAGGNPQHLGVVCRWRGNPEDWLPSFGAGKRSGAQPCTFGYRDRSVSMGSGSAPRARDGRFQRWQVGFAKAAQQALATTTLGNRRAPRHGGTARGGQPFVGVVDIAAPKGLWRAIMTTGGESLLPQLPPDSWG